MWQALLLAIVEGLTEFLPVSSTGHMIIASSFMGIAADPFVKQFTVAVQFGAILAVVLMYRERFFKGIGFYVKLFVAFVPAGIAGYLFHDRIEALLENVFAVACTLVAGGVFLLFVDRLFARNEEQAGEGADADLRKAWWIGCFQVLSLVPGTSRAAATIVGGLCQGLKRRAAAEFSFFLAVPTMAAATGYSLLKHREVLTASSIPILLLGNLAAFVVAWLAVKGFITLLARHGFFWFGVYRILLGGLLLILLAAGVDLQIL